MFNTCDAYSMYYADGISSDRPLCRFALHKQILGNLDTDRPEEVVHHVLMAS